MAARCLQGPPARAYFGLPERRDVGLARLSHKRKDRLAPVHRFLFQKQGKRLPRPGRARQSLAALEGNAAVQGDRSRALRLGRPLRGRVRTGKRRNQQVQEGFRRAAGTHVRLHATGNSQGPHLASASRGVAASKFGSPSRGDERLPQLICEGRSRLSVARSPGSHERRR
jgi:hypothetical protein